MNDTEVTERQPENEKEYEKKRLTNVPETNVYEEQPFWENSNDDEDEEEEDEAPITRKEIEDIIMKKMVSFWESQRKSEQPYYWERGINKEDKGDSNSTLKSQMFWEAIDSELKRASNRNSSREVSLNYQQELDRMRKQPDNYTDEEKQACVDAAFGEICGAFSKNRIITKDEAAVAASRNIRTRKFRSH